MKINTITAENFLGLVNVNVVLDRTVTLFGGANAAGKSSIKEAVRVALAGEVVRVQFKKDWTALVHDGAKTGFVEIGVVTNDEPGLAAVVLPSGKTKQVGYQMPDALPFVLDAQRFATMKPDERRKFLFGLMKVKMDPASVKARLISRDCNAAKVERIAPILRAGFEAAAEDAKAKATEAKGAWRQVTGEAYGEVKAEEWRAPVPAFDAKAAAAVATELQHLDVAIEQWVGEVAKLQAVRDRRTQLLDRLPQLRSVAELRKRRETKLGVDETELKRLDAEIEKTAAAAGGGPRIGLVHTMARALESARDEVVGTAAAADVAAALTLYEAEHGPLSTVAGDPAAAGRLKELQTARATCASAVANDRRDIDASKAAATEFATIESELAEPHDADALAAARLRIDQLKAQRAEKAGKSDALKVAKAAADAAAEKTRAAAAHHFDVLQWTAIGDALSPSGIPADLLFEALEPINGRLQQSALDTDWLRAGVGADMEITCGDGRQYRLLSESEQWRVDAMVAEAVSHLSGLRLIVLDRFDVLDLQGRSDLLAWLDVLATQDEIDTALVFGTLKSVPASLPASTAAIWVESGMAATEGAQLAQAA